MANIPTHIHTHTTITGLIEECCRGLKQYSYNCIYKAGTNGHTICKYIIALRSETDLSDNYRENLISILSRISQFHRNKPFKSMKRQDIITFLDQNRKSDAEDRLHKWIGTYNLFLTYIISFFKWLYHPNDIDRPKPDVVKNIGRLTRREKTIYTPSDLWSPEDDELFLKYCDSKRLKCYHTVSRDTSARPHEIAGLKVKDIQFLQNNDGTQFVEVPVNGKTGNRFLPLFNSVPYVKDYLDHEHPQPNNLNAPFFCATYKSLGKHLLPSHLRREYVNQKKLFVKLLDSPTVPQEDKTRIKLLLGKPWNPYIRRHSGLTEKASNPEIAVILENYAGWVPGSNMKERYIHLLSNQASNSILQAYGVIPKEPNELKLRVKQCPQCNEPNTPDSKFCAKCRMVLRYDGYQESVEKQRENENKLAVMEERFNSMQSQMQSLITALGSMDQSAKNTFAKQLFENGVYLNQRSAN